MLKSLLRRLLESVTVFRSQEFRVTAYDLVKKTPRLRGETSPFTPYLDWRHEQIQQLALYAPSSATEEQRWIYDSYYGKVDRMALLASFLRSALAVPGDIAEFGVFRGETAIVMDRVLAQHGQDRKLYLFDSFQGMQVTNPLDRGQVPGNLANPVDVEYVRGRFGNSPRPVIVPGFFADTFPHHESLQFAFCHVDCDLYASVTQCMDFILPRLPQGGIVLFDDYGFRDCPGAKAAIQETFARLSREVVPLPTGQAIYLHLTGPAAITQMLSKGMGAQHTTGAAYTTSEGGLNDR